MIRNYAIVFNRWAWRLACLLGLGAWWSCAAQEPRAGTVNFQNVYRTVGVYAPFYDDQGVFLAGPRYAAQLYASVGPTNLVPVGAPTPFRTRGDGGVASIEGNTVVNLAAAFVYPEKPAWVQMRAWDTQAGTGFEAAVAAGGWTGVSTLLYIPQTGDSTGEPGLMAAELVGLEFVPRKPPFLPGITNQPTSQIVSEGEPVVISVGATNGTLAYQWRHQGTLLPGAINDVLRFDPVNSRDSGTYDVVVSNASGSITSQVARLEVFAGTGVPVVRLEPADLRLRMGESGTFEVAATGAQPISYQWYRGLGGDVSNPIPGATNSPYRPSPSSQDAVYWVRASNAIAATDSRTVTLRVFPEQAARLATRLAARQLGSDSAAISYTIEGKPFFTYRIEGTLGFPPNWGDFEAVSFILPESPFSFTYSAPGGISTRGFFRAATQ